MLPIMDPAEVCEIIERREDAVSKEREVRANHISYYLGRWNIGRKRRSVANPAGLLAQAVHGINPSLSMHNPLMTYTARRPDVQPEAYALKLILDQRFEEQDFNNQVLRPLITDAIFSPYSTLFTFRATSERAGELHGSDIDPGDTCSTHVPFDAHVFDNSTRNFRTRQWESHRFLANREFLLGSPAYAQAWDQIAGMMPVERSRNRVGRDAADFTSVLGEDEDRDLIELRFVAFYLPNGRMIEAVLPAGDAGERKYVLPPREWEGAEGGPYDSLYWFGVPSNAMPASPMTFWRDPSESGDDLTRKLFNAAKRVKSLLVYSPDSADDADSIANAEDGDSVRSRDPKGAQILTFNQAVAEVGKVLEVALGTWNNVTGNPNLVGGTQEVASTATGMDILATRSNVRLGDFMDRIEGVVGSVGRKTATNIMSDPLMNVDVPVPLPGGGMAMLSYSSERRVGTPRDFMFKCQPRSTVGLDPNLQAARFIEALRELPNIAQLSQMGFIRFPDTLRELGRMLGTDSLERICAAPDVAMQNRLIADTVDRYLAATASGAGGPPSTSGMARKPMPTTPQGQRQGKFAANRR